MATQVDRRHYYRFKFLKSEQWQTARSAALADADGRCALCLHRDISNDAHHVWYPRNIWQTKAEHLVILCRECHTLVHSVLPTPSSFKTEQEAKDAFSNFRASLLYWLDCQRALLGSRRRLEAFHQKEDKFCKICRWTEDIEHRNLLQNYPYKSRRVVLCGKCWDKMIPRLPHPDRNIYTNNLPTRVYAWVRAARKQLTELRKSSNPVISTSSLGADANRLQTDAAAVPTGVM